MKKTNSIRKIWYSLSSNQRFLFRRLYYFPIDLLDQVLGRRHKYVPPRGMIYTGSSIGSKEYLKQGQFQLNLLKEEIDLLPSDKVLDIGSGVGRTAIALTKYLNKEGTYDGFDVVKKGVEWCNKGIGEDFSNFKFKYVPVFNDLYNTSKMKATEFKFPYGNNSFDKVFSISLFTHMQLDEIQHYFYQIARVVKPNGLCFSTFFLYDSHDEKYISEKEHFNFPYKREGYRLMNENVKSGNIAIHKNVLKSMLQNAGMEYIRIVDGFWKSKTLNNTGREYQDIVIFKRI
ncbi:class I SAM-dependent methyltransferase [Aestuariivivens sediminis]|uniref:class I SAM-dependent methyltransferase n=1 Tax=Aestuariivivens sediminis TaxID=2913557 RepID=UPI001F5A0E0F|nr:class I SAM-dependent methyltransferase [Aestuariivivens sediminis]